MKSHAGWRSGLFAWAAGAAFLVPFSARDYVFKRYGGGWFHPGCRGMCAHPEFILRPCLWLCLFLFFGSVFLRQRRYVGTLALMGSFPTAFGGVLAAWVWPREISAALWLFVAAGLQAMSVWAGQVPRWVWVRLRSRPSGVCLGCGYDMRGLPTQRCPECGWERGVVDAG